MTTVRLQAMQASKPVLVPVRRHEATNSIQWHFEEVDPDVVQLVESKQTGCSLPKIVVGFVHGMSKQIRSHSNIPRQTIMADHQVYHLFGGDIAEFMAAIAATFNDIAEGGNGQQQRRQQPSAMLT